MLPSSPAIDTDHLAASLDRELQDWIATTHKWGRSWTCLDRAGDVWLVLLWTVGIPIVRVTGGGNVVELTAVNSPRPILACLWGLDAPNVPVPVRA